MSTVFCEKFSAATLKHTMVGQKYFKEGWGKNTLRGGGANECLGVQKYTKYNKLNNNSEKFTGGKIAARPGKNTIYSFCSA